VTGRLIHAADDEDGATYSPESRELNQIIGRINALTVASDSIVDKLLGIFFDNHLGAETPLLQASKEKLVSVHAIPKGICEISMSTKPNSTTRYHTKYINVDRVTHFWSCCGFRGSRLDHNCGLYKSANPTYVRNTRALETMSLKELKNVVKKTVASRQDRL